MTWNPRKFLLMAEHVDVFLWWRSGEIEDQTEVVEELSSGLRAELGAWNLTFAMTSSTGFEFPSEGVELQHRVDAFTLATQVQRELGPNTVIFCAAGQGDNFFGAGGRHPVPGSWYPRILVRGTDPGTTVFDWAPRAKFELSAEKANLQPSTAHKLESWREQLRVATTAQKLGGFEHLEARAVGLEVTALVQRDIGIAGNALFFGGNDPQNS